MEKAPGLRLNALKAVLIQTSNSKLRETSSTEQDYFAFSSEQKHQPLLKREKSRTGGLYATPAQAQ